MKIKIIEDYELRPGRFWKPEQIADVTNDFGKELIEQGFAHELRMEKRKDSKGLEFEVQVEIVDKQGTTISHKINDNEHGNADKAKGSNRRTRSDIR